MQGMATAYDWNDLKYFLSCSRVGTLAGAGRLLKVDETTVGRRLAALEQALGARLFDRTSDGFVLTSTGERLLGTAEEVEQATIDLERKATGADVKLEGMVRVATTETLAVMFLARHLARLRAAHPGIVVEMVSALGTTNLLKRDADLAVRVGAKPTQQSLIVRRLGAFSWGLYTSRAHSRHRRKAGRTVSLDGHDVIGYCEELALSTGARWLEEHARGATVVFRTNSILAAAQAARGGWGVAILPTFVGEQESGLVRLSAEALSPVNVWLAVHADLQRNARVRAVIEHLVAGIAESAALDAD
jgi:DNA-binding transcriptional LysR family regulator